MQKVGQIEYEVDIDTRKLITGQREVDRAVGRTAASLDSLGARLTATAAAAFAAAFAAIKIAKLADEVRLMGARVEVAAGNVQAGTAAFAELVKISSRTQSSLAGNIEVFNRLNQSILQMGGTQRDTLQVTELLAKAIKVSGASATEAKAAMLQFGQALGSGKLAGDELRSLMETAPYLMRQLADGIGVPVGALKKLGEEGKLTADVVTNALSKAAAQIDADFKKFPQTIESAMVVASDAAALAILEFDKLSGSSAALTGVTKGAGEVIEKLAQQFAEAGREAGNLSRNDAFKSWSQKTKEALSYLVDAADLARISLTLLGSSATYAFETAGNAIAGYAAVSARLLKGDLDGARAVGQAWRDAGDARRKAFIDAGNKTVGNGMLAGQKMRAGWAMGDLGQSDPTELARRGRGQGGISALRPPGGAGAAGGGKPKAGAKFDAAGYLAGLERATLDGIALVDAVEQEALRKNAEHLKAKQIDAEDSARAITLIEKKAAQDRRDIVLGAAEEQRAFIQKSGEEELEARARLAEQNARANERAAARFAEVKAVADPLGALRDEYERRLAMVVEYEQRMAAAGVSATEQGQIARTQITAEYELQRQAMAEQAFVSQGAANAFLMDSLNALSTSASSAITGLLTGTLSAQDAMRGLASVVLNEAVGALVQIGVQYLKNLLISQTVDKAMIASKATNAALYTAAVSAQVGVNTALAAQAAFASTAAIPIVGPVLAPAAAAAAGAASAAFGAPAIAAAPLAGARQYGGPVSSGSLYRVNETGRSEMFVGSAGQQYLMPTQSGKVIPADQVGGAGKAPTVIIQNMGSPVAVQSQSWDQQSNTMHLTIGEAARQIREREGPMWAALGTTNVRGQF